MALVYEGSRRPEVDSSRLQLQCVPLSINYSGPIICNNLPVVTVCGGVVGLMTLSVSVAYCFKIHGRVTDKTMTMNVGVYSVVT